MQHRGAISGWDGLDWISPGGVMYRAPYGANKIRQYQKQDPG